jgi:hypothetical protein
MFELEEASAISMLANNKYWKQFVTPHLENRRDTLIRDIKKSRDSRDELVGRLLELDDFTVWIDQHIQDYKETKKEE